MRGIVSFTLTGIFLFCLEVFATEIPAGPVSGDWYASGNPYNINGEIYVDSTAILNIHEGVEVIFQGHYTLTVYGELQAIGTESDSILFTAADTSLGWGDILFRDSNMLNALSYCIIQYGKAYGASDCGGGVELINATAIIDHSTIRWNRADLSGGGISCWEASNLNLESCLITENYSLYDGAGISLYENTYVRMNNCTISDNRVGSIGGGMAFFYSVGDVSNCLFSRNVAIGGGGGGLFCISYGCHPTFSNCTFTDNSAGAHGGGAHCREGASAIFFNCMFSGNYAAYCGGGVNLYTPGNVILENCRITDNTSASDGGGIRIYSSSNPLIKNCTIANNVSTGGVGGGISINNSAPEIINTIVEGNEGNGGLYFYDLSPVNITYCDIANNLPANLMGSVPAGLGDLVGVNGCGDSCDVFMNIFMDPLFRDPANGDYHLQSMTDPQCGDSDDSPCIDAGDPAILDVVLDCAFGLGGSVSDMGAYGGENEIQTVVSESEIELPTGFSLRQNYPNPFNAQTTVGFILPEAGTIQLKIYDLLGRQVKTLIDEQKQAGFHSIVFDASGLSSGVYLYRLQAGNTVETKRMVLLK